ncbi:MAG: DUF1513 domain-containing protein [Halomonas sp.]|uniref:DUF1513 domain-containing protein n=1 Tax=Halomonas sp. TaxID=1486246 RepID=UPI002ACDEB27|nr:DUF1513 domain-containing protein [Halomonas sp.]MDZ7851279.1 DUF1513 domain-containing protein [Halomonas sp.]
MWQRREFLKAAVVGLGSLGLPPLGWAQREHQNTWLWSAIDDAQGHQLIGYQPATGSHCRIPVPERCHSGCRRPGCPQIVLFSRRPGRSAHVLDGIRQREITRITAGPAYHFYGHGAFSPDGRYLYATANRIEDGTGVIRVFDAENDYALEGEIDLTGIGPHELRLMPDGQTLVVGLGGIRTHPDYGRVKLNLDDMAPALLLVDRLSGEILERHTPSHHQLSCRHLDVAPDGSVLAGYQFQGPAWERQPLLAFRGPEGAFAEIVLPDDLTDELRHYIASIAMAPDTARALITAPRGHRVLLLDRDERKLMASHHLPDAAGALPDGRGGFWVSSGQGELFSVPGDGSPPLRIDALDLSWDNHLS